jgi:hypothetical protein
MRMEKWKISILALAVMAEGISAGTAAAARSGRDGHVFLGAPGPTPQQHITFTPRAERLAPMRPSVTVPQFNRTDNSWRNRSFERERDWVRERDLVRDRNPERERRRFRNGALLGLGVGLGLGALTYPYYSNYYYPSYSSGYYDPGYWVTSYNGPDGTNCFNSYYGYYGYIYNGYCHQYPPSGYVPY